MLVCCKHISANDDERLARLIDKVTGGREMEMAGIKAALEKAALEW